MKHVLAFTLLWLRVRTILILPSCYLAPTYHTHLSHETPHAHIPHAQEAAWDVITDYYVVCIKTANILSLSFVFVFFHRHAQTRWPAGRVCCHTAQCSCCISRGCKHNDIPNWKEHCGGHARKNVSARFSALAVTVLMCNFKGRFESMLTPRSVACILRFRIVLSMTLFFMSWDIIYQYFLTAVVYAESTIKLHQES